MADPKASPPGRTPARGIPPALWSLLVLCLFAASIAVLHGILREYRLHDILDGLRAIPRGRLAAASLLTALGYLVLTGYDLLAFRYLGVPLAYGRVALASFLSYAFANNTGSLSLIAGGGVRFRLYAGWGLSTEEIARVVAFTTVSFWLGFLSLGGVLFFAEPFAIPVAFRLPVADSRPIGAVFLAAAGAYLLANAARRAPVRVLGREVPLPGFRLSLAQIGVSMVDWTLAALVLHLLLPPATLPFPLFLGAYLLSQIAGLASTVPGGLGVFESAMLLLLAPAMPVPAIFGALVAYRVVYYVLPLAVAGALLVGHEVFPAKERVRGAALAIGRIVPGVVPEVLALLTFAAGAVLLFSGSLPAESRRFAWLRDVVPLPLIELSHLLGSLVGTALLLLAVGLQRRLDAAWVLSTALLGAGAAASLLKGLDYEEAAVLLLILLALLPSRRRFYRRAALLAEPFSPGWVLSAAAVFAASAWLVAFSYKHVEYSHSLWWQVAFAGHAPRSLRALLGGATLVLVVAGWRLLRAAHPRPVPPTAADLDRAAAIASAAPRTNGYLALLGDKSLLFSANGAAFLTFGVQGRSWVALGDVVGSAEEAPELLWTFRGLADRHGGRPVLYEAGAEQLPLILDLGLVPLKIGEEARVPLEGFSLAGGAHKGLRHAHQHLLREGCTFEIAPPGSVPSILGELRRVSDAWLEEKQTREKRFSLGFFSEGYLRRFPVALVRRAGALIAFANLWPGGGKEELSVDLMRYVPAAPAGVMDFLFAEILSWGRREGYRWFNFGMAPLSGLQGRPFAPLWNRVGAFIYSHGEPLYNFEGLRAYKEKFGPEWAPRYLAVPNGLSLPPVLADIAVLISGGAKGIVAK